MGDRVEATLTRTIACSKCGRMRHVCIADKNDAACLSSMNFERKHGICRSCEHGGGLIRHHVVAQLNAKRRID